MSHGWEIHPLKQWGADQGGLATPVARERAVCPKHTQPNKSRAVPVASKSEREKEANSKTLAWSLRKYSWNSQFAACKRQQRPGWLVITTCTI